MTKTAAKTTPLPPNRPLSKRKAARAEALIAQLGRDAFRVAPTGDENVRLLVDVLAYAAEETARAKRARRADRKQSRFDMTTWSKGLVRKVDNTPPPMACGTSACLAGTATAFSLQPDEVMIDSYIYRDGPAVRSVAQQIDDGYLSHEGDLHGVLRWAGPVDRVGLVARRGQAVLGLNDAQAGVLFYMTSSSLADIALAASYIVGRDITSVVA